jgi:hypothetical protein
MSKLDRLGPPLALMLNMMGRFWSEHLQVRRPGAQFFQKDVSLGHAEEFSVLVL